MPMLKHLSYRSAVLASLFIFFHVSSEAQTLDDLIDKSIRTYPSIKGQDAMLASAASGVEGARWQFYPTPSVSVETVNSNTTDRLYMGDTRVVTARLQQPLWTAGRLTAGLDKAQASLTYTQATLEETRLQLGLRVIQTYGEWLASHLKLLALERSRAVHLRLEEQVKRRSSEGASALSDVTLANSRLELVEADIASTRAARDAVLAKLGQLVGFKVEGITLADTIALPMHVNSEPLALLEQAIATSPSIAKAKSQAMVQEAGIRERRADLLPEVYARLERQYGNYAYIDTAPETRMFIGLSTRLGAGLSTQSGIEAAIKQHESSLAEVETQTRTVSEAILADLSIAASTEARSKALIASLQAAEDVARSYDRQFLAGRKSWLDVMNAAREIAQTEMQLAELRSTQIVISWRIAAYAKGIQTLTKGVK